MTIVSQVYNRIASGLKGPYFGTLDKPTDLMNHINQVAKVISIDNFNMEYPEEYAEVLKMTKELIRSKKSQKNESMSKKTIKETTMTIPTSSSILRYEEDDAVKIFQQVFKDNFENFKLTKIQAQEGGVFYNLDIVCELEEDIRDDMELKRFLLAQTLGAFRAEFFTVVSQMLPVVNVNTSAYNFTKDSNKLTFVAVVLLSNTNDREWVSGIRKTIDQKKKEETLAKAEKFDKPAVKESKKLKEGLTNDDLAFRKLSNGQPADTRMQLARIFNVYQMEKKKILDKFIQSATELSKYSPDVIEQIMLSEGKTITESPRFGKAYFVMEDGDEVFDEVDKLNAKGLTASVVDSNRLVVKFPLNKYSADDIQNIINEK